MEEKEKKVKEKEIERKKSEKVTIFNSEFQVQKLQVLQPSDSSFFLSAKEEKKKERERRRKKEKVNAKTILLPLFLFPVSQQSRKWSCN